MYTDRLLTLLDRRAYARDVCLCTASGRGNFRVSRLRDRGSVGNHRKHVPHLGPPGSVAVMFSSVSRQTSLCLCYVSYYPPWPYNLYLLASAWLAIAVTLGAVVAQAVFRRGRVNYHRIVGAILLYLLIAVLFRDVVHLYRTVDPGCHQGNNVRRQRGSCQFGLLSEFRHSDIDRIRRYSFQFILSPAPSASSKPSSANFIRQRSWRGS